MSVNRRDFIKKTAFATTASLAAMTSWTTASELTQVARSEEFPLNQPESLPETEPINGRWTEKRINQWFSQLPWLVGCNYVPTYAINQIEMWQKSTFNPTIIDRELALAESIGFNTIRIFAHHLVWEAERDDYFSNIRTFLDLCEQHSLRVIYTIFTNGGKESSVMGPQPDPIPGRHNGEWRQTPGVSKIMNCPDQWHKMEAYVKDTIATFAGNSRILFWDIFNEPANNKTVKDIAGFVRLAFSWTRQIAPPEPLTSAFLTYDLTPINAFLAENCDLMSFHNYEPKEKLEKAIENLEKFKRPIICKEWLARHLGSTIEDCLPLFKEKNVGAVNWGLIPGKLQTQIPWKEIIERFPESQKIWFHDLFDENHNPYSEAEIKIIKELAGEK